MHPLSTTPEAAANLIFPQDYPIEERLWLLSTAYNTGFECLE
jgi:hypothetical protein